MTITFPKIFDNLKKWNDNIQFYSVEGACPKVDDSKIYNNLQIEYIKLIV